MYPYVTLSRRSAAWFIDLALAYTLHYSLYSFDQFNMINSMLIENYLKVVSIKALIPYSSFVCMTIIIYILACLLRAYLSLIFGVGPGQYLVGVRVKGPFFTKRIAGVFRELFSIFTRPLIIFDLPILAKKRPLSELVTLHRLKTSKSITSDTIALGSIFIFLVLAVYAPLLYNFTLIDGVVVNFKKGERTVLKASSKFKLFKNYQSNRLRLDSFTSLKENKIKLIPYFEIKNKGDKRVVNPVLQIYSTDDHSSVTLKMIGKLNLVDLIKKAKSRNPLFSQKFSALDYLLTSIEQNPEKYARRDFQGKSYSLISPSEVEEIVKVVDASFQLGLKNIISHTINYGPFIEGFVDLRQSLLGLINKGIVPIVDIIKIDKTYFLKFEQIHNIKNGESVKHTLIPLNSNNSFVLEIEGEFDNNKKSIIKDVYQEFMASTRWYLDYKKIFKYPSSIEDFGPLTILDYFSNSKITSEIAGDLEKYTFKYFFELAVDAFNREDLKMKHTLIRSINRLILTARSQNSRKQLYDKKFINLLSNMKIAIINDNKNYFFN